MLATENVRAVGTFGPKHTSAPTAETAGHAEWPRPCARRDVCRSLLCQLNRNNTDCTGSRKGN
jgi:hypothetical protein